MTDYEAPDPAVAELVYEWRAAAARQKKRLRDQPSSVLIAVARDPQEPLSARGNALSLLMKRRDGELTDLLVELLEDEDQELRRLALSAVASCGPDDSRIQARLLEIVDDPGDPNWSHAAVALARSSDETLLPRLETWLHHEDRSRRNVAVACLRSLRGDSARRVLQDFWDRGEGDHEDRLGVAAALFLMGDARGLALLDSTARLGRGAWSVFAAAAIYGRQARDGLALMLQILVEGDLQAKQAMVNQIWNLADLPHAFTADGIHEARLWVETELEKE